MLDMFSELPLADVESTPDDRLQEKYTYYDISAIESTPVRVVASQSQPEVRMHWGGIRRDRVRHEQRPDQGGARAAWTAG